MRQFFTSVIERKKEFTSDFQTNPFEAAWASEAIFFIKVEDVSGETRHLDAIIQISPDGLCWVDEGTEMLGIDSKGTYFIKVCHFGGWLRLKARVNGDNAKFKLTIHLVLKE